MKKDEFFQTIQMARFKLSLINELSETIAQNLDYCTESPQAAMIAKYDALTAASELCKTSASILDEVVAIQKYDASDS